MISELIKKKLMYSSLTQANLAEKIGTSPTQLGLFLKGEGASLPTKTLEKCFDLMEINLRTYSRLCDSALKVASILKSRGDDIEKVLRMNKSEIILLTNAQEIKYLIDITDEKEIDLLRETGIVDYQMTFPYFKSMVVFLMSYDGKTGTRSNPLIKTNIWSNIFGVTAAATTISSGVAAIAGHIISSLGEMIWKDVNKDDNQPLAPLRELAKKIMKL